MAESALRGLVSGLMQGGPAPSGMVSAQTAIQNAVQRPQPKPMGQQVADVLGGVSAFLSPVPFVGDVAGLGADAAMYANYPEERTALNYGLTALSAFPFVPNAASYRLAQKGLDIVKVPSGEKYADGAEYFLSDPDGKSAGYMAVQPDMKSSRMKSLDSEIYPQYRGQGVGSDMYDAIQIMENRDFYPSEVLTNDGARFWASRDPELMRKLLSQGYFVDDVQDNVRSALSPLAGK